LSAGLGARSDAGLSAGLGARSDAGLSAGLGPVPGAGLGGPLGTASGAVGTGVDLARRRVGLAELDTLVERAASAGLRVAVEREGGPEGLSGAEELTAYRIVQESVTNALRHAGPGAVLTVRLRYSPTDVRIEAVDDGGAGAGHTGPVRHSGQAGRAGWAVAESHVGHGLIGMRERIAVHGGVLTVGPCAGGGWRVDATIPLARAAAA
ncbi:ATP-binding protein, partial [Dactylosporangium sp. NPDC005572]|uniref:sensor histidine kinase n=1 Tax=Dactylosporangium sp. NPDC005572 TaxID=3156889 RepID=UPI0033A30EC4